MSMGHDQISNGFEVNTTQAVPIIARFGFTCVDCT
jgi:hypothetical protein